MVRKVVGMRKDNNQKGSTLSLRGAELASTPPMPEYLVEHFSRSASPGPNGYTSLCIAENRLVWDLLQEKLSAPLSLPHQAICYDQMIGSAQFRHQLASFMGRSFLSRACDPAHIAVLAGAGSVLEILFHALADPGDGVLVPTPSYAGFWLDLETRDELKIIPVHCRSDDGFRLSAQLLDRAMAEADRPVRALLFTNPNNPLGRVASPAEVLEVLDWADSAKVHVVFDEIYALSVFGENAFTSCAALRPRLGENVHIVWAFSKDFGASGLRCGVLLSENQELMAAVDALSYWACCSGHTQYLLGEMISDEQWVDGYIRAMQSRLGDAHNKVCDALQSEGIPHLRADGGFFVVCDLREFLAQQSWPSEHELWRRILDEASANLTPGAACHNGEPGFFRLCYASVSPDEAVSAIQRIGKVLRS